MPVPRDGETISPSGCVRLHGRSGEIVRRPERGCCTWCGLRVTEPRRSTWCSQWCVDAFRATQPQHQRSAAFARDGGVCSLCGLQTERIRQAVVRWVDRRARRSEWWTRHRRVPRGFGACDVSRLLNRLGLATSDSLGLHLGCARLRSSWWDLDHRVPIADGGHPYDLRNLRTLCVWCHQDETARAATARAEARRGWVEPEAAQVLLFADSVQRIRMGLDA